MSTIQELIQLQKFNINEAKPLTVTGQYSKNTKVDINKVVQSVSLLTSEINKLNSNVQESTFNTGVNFSMNQWVEQTKNALTPQLLPSLQTLIGNQKPLTKTITLTNTVIVTSLQTTLNQQDNLLSQLENQIYKLLEKQNNVKIEKDKDGNVTLVPILSENSQTSLNNINKILSTTTSTLDKINIRISNDLPLRNIDDFVNNLSLKHIIDFTQKIISVLTLTLQIQIKIRQAKDLAASANSLTLGNAPAAASFALQATQISSHEQKQIDDLSAAQSTIGIIKSQILFYQGILQSILIKLQNLLNLITSLQPNTPQQTQQTQQIVNNLQSILTKIETNNQQTIPLQIIRTNNASTGYAAKIEI
jgi:hypothetical protein